MKYMMPPFFGLLSFLLYLAFYRPHIGGCEFITALMVFFAALAWSAVINLSSDKKKWILYFYLSISVIIPFLMAILLKEFHILWHTILIGLTTLATMGLSLFVPVYLKYNKRK